MAPSQQPRSLVHLDGGHAPQAAGEHQHLHGLGVHLLQRHIGGDGNAVAPCHHRALQPHQGYLHPRPAQQIGREDRLGLLKPFAQQNIYHIQIPSSYISCRNYNLDSTNRQISR